MLQQLGYIQACTLLLLVGIQGKHQERMKRSFPGVLVLIPPAHLLVWSPKSNLFLCMSMKEAHLALERSGDKQTCPCICAPCSFRKCSFFQKEQGHGAQGEAALCSFEVSWGFSFFLSPKGREKCKMQSLSWCYWYARQICNVVCHFFDHVWSTSLGKGIQFMLYQQV